MKQLIFTFILATLCGIPAFAANNYDFSAMCESGQTLYYNITSSSSPYQVEVTYQTYPQYNFNTNQYSNSSYSSLSGILTIPSSVTYSGRTYSVTSIGEVAFASCSGLTSVIIPNSVSSIGRVAFDCCSGLASVTIGSGVTSIDDGAFLNCSGLTTVNFNATNCTSMGINVWSGCTLLSTLNIGENVTNIPDYAFSNCSGLTAVYYAGTIEQWCGITFPSYPFPAHNLYINSSLVTNLVIPNTVEEIKAYAFSNANSLTSVTIPNSVTSIGCCAFGCSGLSGTLTIPNSVTSIGYCAFGSCSGLTTLNFNAENCSNVSISIGFTTLTKITIGENVATIPNYAFSGCTSLDSIISYANNPPVIYGGTFDSELSLNTPVVVPCGMVETYEDADFWYNFRRIQQRPDCGATYTITVLSSNNAWGSVSGGGTYMAGETASLIASANEGYRFSNWSDGSTENPHNITVTQNETYIATFVVSSSLPTIYSSFSAEACGSYTWNNQTYTESGEYQQTFTAANSADSVVTLTLTILPAPQPTITLYGELDACNPSSVALVTGQYQSYLWSNGATTIATSVIEPGYYYVEVTGENGCTGISEQTNVGVSNAITEAPQISVVGMNSMNRNVVTWSAMANYNVTAYRIYRENNIANVYEPMATVVASAQTYWTDETADPSSRAYRYKVTAVDECGGESPMSDYHKTMHLTINKGIGNTWNLIWSHYEGFGFGTYRVYRGTSPSNMTMIGEVPSNLNSYTDNTATASTGFYYQVEVVRNTRDAEISSRSNIVTTEGNGIEENVTMEIALFPNPVTDILNITSSEPISEIEIVNVMGQVVRRVEVNSDNAVCDVEDLTAGVYVVRISAEGMVVSQRKFVKE